MATITFYEKPGCKGNARQKALLQAAGHTVDAHNLKTEPWTTERLLGFLSPLPVSDWFNPSAPAIKSGEIDPTALSRDDALALLLGNPLLIRRPLMETATPSGVVRLVGFDPQKVAQWVGLNGVALPEGNIEACVHGPEGHGSCGSHAHEHEESDHGRCGSH